MTACGGDDHTTNRVEEPVVAELGQYAMWRSCSPDYMASWMNRAFSNGYSFVDMTPSGNCVTVLMELSEEVEDNVTRGP